jgi:hypothetical protein
MKSFLLKFIVYLLFHFGIKFSLFSQTNNKGKVSSGESISIAPETPKPIVHEENKSSFTEQETIDPEKTGSTKQIINGETYYIKHNERITIIYKPE